MSTSRQSVITAIGDGLRSNPSVYAMWLEGADAHGIDDEYSDVDIWLDVEDGEADAVMLSIKAILTAINPLDYDVEVDHPHPKIRQASFHIQGTPEFMILDICIQDHSRESAFLAGFADHKVKVVFDKCGVISYRDVDCAAFRQELSHRIEELSKTFPLARTGVSKEIKRGNYLEALDCYHGMLGYLVELLRIEHQPTKRDYCLKHIRRDLPAEIVAKLEHLFAVSSLEDIEAKCKEADEMFRKVASDLESSAPPSNGGSTGNRKQPEGS